VEGCEGEEALTTPGRLFHKVDPGLTVCHPLDLALDYPRPLSARYLEIVMRLKVDPELRARVEESGKPECCVGRDRPLTFDDPSDAIDRHTKGRPGLQKRCFVHHK
jgi:hypothetical protein